MNPQISRRSFRASAHYSGVLHQQGRMIVDADLNEQADITDARLVDLLRATVGSGAPAADGLGLQVDAGRPVLVPGRLVVDGLSARLDGLPGDRIGLDQQPDYPGAPTPTATAFRVYADVWERSVTALEDSALMDPGLHGADTAARSQTVLQVKTCPFTLDPLSPVANPPQGNAPLTLTLKTSTTAGSAGDPCAAAGSVSERIGNYLFRIEVHDLVTRGGQEHLVIKWSRDNGAEACRVGEEPPGFTQGAWSWEFFDADSEKQAGLHPFATQVRRGVLVDAPYQSPSGSQPKAFARQWDGWADINLADSTVSGSERGVALASGANGQVSFDTRSGRALVLDLEMMTLRLELQAGGASARHAFVPGDHWLACVREAERETLETPAGSQLLDRALPAGIAHHLMELGRWDGSRWQPAGGLSDAAWRQRMAFHPLTDLQADAVSYLLPALHPPLDDVRARLTGLKEFSAGARIPVQAAIDALVLNLDADSIPYASGDGTAGSIAGLMVKKTGDTMSGPLTVNNTLSVSAFKLAAASTTPDKAVLTYEKSTGLALWSETALTAWTLSGGNLSTDPGSVTGSITIGTPASAGAPPLCVAGGRVGIGTDAPATPLHIVAQASDRARDFAAYGLPWLWGQHIADGATKMWGLTQVYGRVLTWDSDSLFVGLKDEGADRKDAVIAWGDNANDRLRFLYTAAAANSTTTTVPAPVEVAQLTTDGALRVGGEGGASLLGNAALGAVFGQNVATGGSGDFVPATDAPYAALQASEGALSFHTSAGNLGAPGDSNPRVVIDPLGRVGIGTTDTSRARLVVDGDIYVTGRVIQGAEIMVLAEKDWDNVTLNTSSSSSSLGGMSFVLPAATSVTFGLALLTDIGNGGNQSVPIVVRLHSAGAASPVVLFQTLQVSSTGVLMTEAVRALAAGFYMVEVGYPNLSSSFSFKTLSVVATESRSAQPLATTTVSPTL